jgi:hypothetical protein
MGDYAGAAEAYTRSQALQAQVLKKNQLNQLARHAGTTSKGSTRSSLGPDMAIRATPPSARCSRASWPIARGQDREVSHLSVKRRV